MKLYVLQSAGGTVTQSYARSLRQAIEYAEAAYPDTSGWRPIRID